MGVSCRNVRFRRVRFPVRPPSTFARTPLPPIVVAVVRLGLPRELRRSLACTNIIENMLGSVRRVCRNVKRWRDASIALRWTAAAMLEAAKGFRPEWQDLLRDLDRLQQGVIEKDGKRIVTRTHVEGVVGRVFQAAGIALPPHMRELTSQTT